MTIHLRTWSDVACFTRLEMKVECVSSYSKMAFRGAAPFGVTVSDLHHGDSEARRIATGLPRICPTPRDITGTRWASQIDSQIE